MIMEEPMIYQYFHTGFKYEKIIALLERYHGVEVSLCILHQLLRKEKSLQKRYTGSCTSLVSFIQLESQGSGSCIGYLAMQQKYINNSLNGLRAVVTQIRRELDPAGVDERQKRTLRPRLYYSKGPKWIGILMVMISLSHLGVRFTDLLMYTVDTYYG